MDDKQLAALRTFLETLPTRAGKPCHADGDTARQAIDRAGGEK